MDIIDPNRDVSRSHLPQIIVTNDGETILGIITSETASSITVGLNFGDEQELLRANISKIQSSEESLMPNGLQVRLNDHEMPDLLEFVSKAGKRQKSI